GTFAHAGTVPGHDADEDGDCSEIEDGESKKRPAHGAGNGFGGGGLAGGHGNELDAAKCVNGEGDGEERGCRTEGKESPVSGVLRSGASGEQESSAEHDEHGDDGGLDHGKPEFEAPVVVHT